MKAIILAAGYGSRMYPLAQDMPKCLLAINNETLLARQLRILKSCGINDIAVVTGFQKEMIVELYGDVVSIRYNPHYGITGTIFSLWIARDLLNDDVIVLNADVVFTKELIKTLLVDDKRYCLVVENRRVLDGEDMKVKIDGDNIIEVSKLILCEEAFGEHIGIAKIRKEGVEILKTALLQRIRQISNTSWSTVFQEIVEMSYRVNYIFIGSPWIEIDTKEDYAEAKRIFQK